MPQTVAYSMPARRPRIAAPRELIWIEEPHFLGWGCSDCAWLFKPSVSPVGDSLQEMKKNFLCLRDEEHAAHVCAEHPRAKKAGIQIVRTAVQSLHRTPQRGRWARPGIARQRTARHNGTRF
jgi:hypothetical protein